MRYKYLFLLLFGLFLMGCVPSTPSATGTMRYHLALRTQSKWDSGAAREFQKLMFS